MSKLHNTMMSSCIKAKSIIILLGWLLCLLLLLLCQMSDLARCSGVIESGEKTADLSVLINETVAINNKSTGVSTNTDKEATQKNSNQFRDDWTFDRIEYDLIEFLQELNARYQRHDQATSNQNKSVNVLSSNNNHQTVTVLPGEQLPVSLASDDNDLSESKWQYGIFDRFTRARSSTAAPSLAVQQANTPEPAYSSSGARLDVRSFNSDECGLRTYSQETPDSGGQSGPSMFPQPADLEPLSGPDSSSSSAAAAAATSDDGPSEASKELNQRRQRPPPLSNSWHKFKQSSSETNQDTATNNDANDAAATNGANSGTENDAGELNLNSRRQWLQQQLGNTLQLLGLNATSTSVGTSNNNNHLLFNGELVPGDKQQAPTATANVRENMMKMSSAQMMARREDKKTPNGGVHEYDDDNEPALIKQLNQLRARQDELKLEARVIGGTDARLGDSPWSVSLQALVARPGTGGVEYRHYCGGTILSEYYILTAAHCLDFMVGRESRLFVVMGDLNWRMSPASMYGRRMGIEKLIIHSGYKSTAFGHDIGLIKTKEPIKPLRANGRYIINSVCLPERNHEHTGEAELVGWGLFSNRNEMADSLQIADVPILPRPLCVDLYRRRTGLIQWLIGIELITDKQICAGTFGRGICQGDSGSALVFNENISRPRNNFQDLNGKASTIRIKSNLARDQQSRATIIGVVAFGGIRRCSYQSLPGVYMQTSKYLDWILPRISA